MNRPTCAFLVVTMLMVAPGDTVRAAQPDSPDAIRSRAQVAKLLENSGYKYSKFSDGGWVINFSGNSLSKVTVLVTAAPDLLVAFVVVGNVKNVKPTSDLYPRLLRLCAKYDLVKIILDDYENIAVRTDSKLSSIDVDEFKYHIRQLAVTADMLHEQIQPLLMTVN